MDGRMRAVQTNEQQMEQTEPRVDAEHPPKKPPAGQCLDHVNQSAIQTAVNCRATTVLFALFCQFVLNVQE
jgi:hypothetical protein